MAAIGVGGQALTAQPPSDHLQDENGQGEGEGEDPLIAPKASSDATVIAAHDSARASRDADPRKSRRIPD